MLLNNVQLKGYVRWSKEGLATNFLDFLMNPFVYKISDAHHHVFKSLPLFKTATKLTFRFTSDKKRVEILPNEKLKVEIISHLSLKNVLNDELIIQKLK